MRKLLLKSLLLVFALHVIGCLMTPDKIACLATNKVESVAEYIYRLAYNREIPGMTDEQWNKIVSLYTSYRQSKSAYDSQLKTLNGTLIDYFTQPLPQKAMVMSLQQQINSVETKADESAIASAYEIRKVLTPGQLEEISGQNLDSMFSRVTLTNDQKAVMLPMLKLSAALRDRFNKDLELLQFNQALMLKSPIVNEKELFENQDKINQVQAEIANEDLRLKLKLRKALTWFQLNRLYNSHRSNVFGALGLSKEQNDKVMELHCKREDITTQSRKQEIDMGADLMTAYKNYNSDIKTLSAIQGQIDNVINQARIGESQVVVEIREVLTPEQRNKLVDIVKLENAGKVPPLPYPEETCPAHHH